MRYNKLYAPIFNVPLKGRKSLIFLYFSQVGSDAQYQKIIVIPGSVVHTLCITILKVSSESIFRTKFEIAEQQSSPGALPSVVGISAFLHFHG